MIQQLQDFVAAWARPVTACQLIGGNLVQVKFPVGGQDVLVFHNLGTSAVNWLLGNLSGAGSIYNSPNAAPTPSKNILLRCTGAGVTASLWFFAA